MQEKSASEAKFLRRKCAGLALPCPLTPWLGAVLEDRLGVSCLERKILLGTRCHNMVLRRAPAFVHWVAVEIPFKDCLVWGICGQLAGSALRLTEEAVEFATGGMPIKVVRALTG